MYQLHLGDCLEVMPGIADGSVDFIFTDPPYPYIKREYGYWTEETWMPMMQEVVRQGRRTLKPHGSMVMILQPNSEKVGKMRLWLWRFMLWCGEYWNIVQDAYWWNWNAMPWVGSAKAGLLRSSSKPCVWAGSENCYRNQLAVMWQESQANEAFRKELRATRQEYPSGHSKNPLIMYSSQAKNGGSSPFNVIPMSHNNGTSGARKHSAETPLSLTDWWLRYLTKPGDTVLDPFNGSGTTGVAALKLGRKYIGIEKVEKYYLISQERIGQVEQEAKEAQIARERQPYLLPVEA